MAVVAQGVRQGRLADVLHHRNSGQRIVLGILPIAGSSNTRPASRRQSLNACWSACSSSSIWRKVLFRRSTRS